MIRSRKMDRSQVRLLGKSCGQFPINACVSGPIFFPVLRDFQHQFDWHIEEFASAGSMHKVYLKDVGKAECKDRHSRKRTIQLWHLVTKRDRRSHHSRSKTARDSPVQPIHPRYQRQATGNRDQNQAIQARVRQACHSLLLPLWVHKKKGYREGYPICRTEGLLLNLPPRIL